MKAVKKQRWWFLSFVRRQQNKTLRQVSLELRVVVLAVAILAVPDQLLADPKMGKEVERGWSWGGPKEAWLLTASKTANGYLPREATMPSIDERVI